MDSLVLKSPAKLNLYLNVLRKRPDGYHEIETLFEKIALFDIITIRPNKKGIKITTNNPALPTDKRNLVYKAIGLLFKKSGFKGGVWVDIRKGIPLSSGLGGGSSNAATTLLGVTKFFRLGLDRKALIDLGKTIGSDVPFFLGNVSFAIGKGRGDEIYPLSKHINIWHIIITFNFGVSTKMVYNNLNLRLTSGPANVKIPARFILKNDIENLAASLYNRLEEVVLNRYSIINATKTLLVKEGAYGALLSGSGATIFGITKTREEAIAVKRRMQQRLLRPGCKILVIKTMKGV